MKMKTAGKNSAGFSPRPEWEEKRRGDKEEVNVPKWRTSKSTPTTSGFLDNPDNDNPCGAAVLDFATGCPAPARSFTRSLIIALALARAWCPGPRAFCRDLLPN